MDDSENNYRCRICLKEFAIRKFLKRHLIIRHQIQLTRSDGSLIIYKKPGIRKELKSKEETGIQEDYRCDSCHMVFKTRRQLLTHKPRHIDANYIICSVPGCGHRMYKNDRFQHFKSMHTFEPQICETCSRSFRNYELLRKHKYKVHDSYKCPGCHSRVLKRAKEAHDNECSMKYEIVEKIVVETPYKCFVSSCDKSYSSSFLLRRHIKIKHQSVVKNDSGVNMTCKGCTTRFDNIRELNKHKIICVCTLCPICSSPFRTQEKLDQHMARHEEEKVERKFHCPHCTCRFTTSKILQTHIVTRHTNDEPEVGINYECPECDVMYRKASLLKLHLESRHQVLLENPDRVCAICYDIFDTADELPKHVKSEHQKIYACHETEGCKKRYRTEESLRSHAQKHDPNYVPDMSCSLCSKVFPTQKKLSEHFKNHGEELKKQEMRKNT